MKTKNLGGDRLGSGAKMNVSMEGYGRSTHDLKTNIATTMGIGIVYPIHHSIILAGDTRELDIDAMLLTHPTEGPMFDSFKLQVDVFKYDMRLGIAKLHMNLLETGMDMSDIKLPQIYMTADDINFNNDPNNQQISTSAIFKYLLISGLGHDAVGLTTVEREFNAIPWLAYWEIMKNYYMFKQEEDGYVIHNYDIVKTITEIREVPPGGGAGTQIPEIGTGPGANELLSPGSTMNIYYTGARPEPSEVQLISITGEIINIGDVYQEVEDHVGYVRMVKMYDKWIGTRIDFWQYVPATSDREPNLVAFPIKNLDEIKMDILADIKNTGPFAITSSTIAPFGLALKKEGAIWSKTTPLEGLGVKTYQSDLLNNWLNTDWIDGPGGINARSAVQTDITGKFSIDNLLLKWKMYDYLNRIAVAGGTVDDMMEVTYDVDNKTRSEIPTFEGGLSKELVFDQVISNSATADQPLGTIAGRGKLAADKHKGGKIRIENNDTQHAIYMVMASLTPRIRYSQGNRWDTNIKTYEDLHKPQFDQIGFQNLLTDQMASWDSVQVSPGAWNFQTAGKQPAWINYQTEINRAFGNFASQSSEGWMVNDRNYDWDEGTKSIKDVTVYIDPRKWNGVFAYARRDAQNIWGHFQIEDRAIRKMSANQIPNIR